MERRTAAQRRDLRRAVRRCGRRRARGVAARAAAPPAHLQPVHRAVPRGTGSGHGAPQERGNRLRDLLPAHAAAAGMLPRLRSDRARVVSEFRRRGAADVGDPDLLRADARSVGRGGAGNR